MLARIAISTFCTVLLFGAVGAPVRAQSYPQERRYSKSQINQIIRYVENYSDVFRDYVDHKLDHSWLDGSKREDKLNDLCRDMENALDKLRRNFDANNSWWERRADVEDGLQEARYVQDLLNRRHFPSQIYANWRPLKYQLNVLADRYELRRIGQSRYR